MEDPTENTGAPRSGKRRGWLISLATVGLVFLVVETAFRLLPLDAQLDYRFDEDCYWRLKAGQSGSLWMGGGRFMSPTIHIGSDGFRICGDGEGEPGAPEILYLGDSYTFGLGVEDQQTFSARTGEFVEKGALRSRNAGNPGYGVFQSAALLKREFDAGRVADVVVFTIPTGDILRQPFTDEAFEQYRATQKRRKRLRDISRVATFVYRRLIHLKRRKADAPRVVPNERSAKAVEAFRELWEADAQRIREMKTLCDERNAAFIALHWPQPSDKGWNEIVESGLESLAEEMGLIALTGLDERFAGHEAAELSIPGDGHPSVLAHELVARYLAEELAPLLREKEFEEKKDE